MDIEIQKYLRDLTQEEVKLEDMIGVVMALYDKGAKTPLEKQRDFFNLVKDKSETVATYYLRVIRKAEEAKITEEIMIKGVYLDGIRPMGLLRAVRSKIEESDSLKKVHAVALKEEDDFKRTKKSRRKVEYHFQEG